MATRFLLKDKKGHALTIVGVRVHHFVVDLPGPPEEGLEQILTLLKTIDVGGDAFSGFCVEEAKAAAFRGEYPFRCSISTLTIAWKDYE